jgi:hypothetical protein
VGRAFILETPIDEPGDDRRNVAMLWELAGLKDQAPAAEKGFSMLTPAIEKIRKRTASREKSQKRLAAKAVHAGSSKKKSRAATKRK